MKKVFNINTLLQRKRSKVMWKEADNKLKRTFEFKNFIEAFSFMTRVAKVAETQHQHQNWSNVYNTVTIELTTHDAGNVVTDNDRKLAEIIDSVA